MSDHDTQCPVSQVTPGAFLRLARETQGLTVLDVALRTETTPPVSASSRSRLIGAIEDGLVLPCEDDLRALQEVYHFDWQDLEQQTGSAIVSAFKPVLRRRA
jgi:hypothetical protein